MSYSVDEITRLMEKAKELGISTLEVEGVKLQLGAASPSETKIIVPKTINMAPSGETPLPVDHDAPTDDEILYYATPYFDELQAQRARRQEELELEKKPRRVRTKAKKE